MSLTVFHHASAFDHDPGPGHPESPARIRAVMAMVSKLPYVTLRAPSPATDSELLSIHSRDYLSRLAEHDAVGGGAVDPDTIMSAGTLEAARFSAGGVIDAVRHVLATGTHAFSAGRPPGHHALAGRAMGFCLFANVVLGARTALAGGAQRILIVDWDVHHGNGTQALVEQDARIRFVSLHQAPWWPGTGAQHERGVGNVFNVPMPAGLARDTYVEALWQTVVTATRDWTPDLLLVSAGFDAMRGDPLGGFTLEADDYGRLTSRLREHLPGTPIVSVLEGGYVPSRLAAGVAAHLAALR